MSKKRNSKPKVEKEGYVVINPFVMGGTSYKRGDKVMLAKATATYYKSIKKI